MAIESINREFEVFMREMMKSQECVQENIESEFRRLIRVTVSSCATMYGFSAEEALKRLNSSGEIIKTPLKVSTRQKDLEKAEKVRVKELEKAEKVRVKELEKAEKVRVKELEKAQKAEIKAFEKAEKQRRFAFESAKKCQEKANEHSERNQMKEQDIASKAIEKAEKLKQKKKKTVTKKVEESDYDSDASTVLMTDSEDEEPVVLFQNIPLIKELNLIRNVKIQKKLSPGVKLARQILDI
jgi:hypothetical protein